MGWKGQKHWSQKSGANTRLRVLTNLGDVSVPEAEHEAFKNIKVFADFICLFVLGAEGFSRQCEAAADVQMLNWTQWQHSDT